MPTSPNENLHKEHRLRVKERFLRDGLEHFAPHEVLELLLFFAIPQKDTNLLGHRLIERFGSLSRVFRATQEELRTVEGIGDHAAALLQLCMPLASYVMADEYREGKSVFAKAEDLGRYFVDRFMGEDTETVYLMLLNNRREMIECTRVYVGSVNSVGVTPRRLIELALRQDAGAVVLAHNHPTGIAIPSSEDIHTTNLLQRAFEAVGVPLLEHILVAGRSYTPILKQIRKNQEQMPPSLRSFYADDGLLPEESR